MLNGLDISGFKAALANVPPVTVGESQDVVRNSSRNYAFPAMTRAANGDILMAWRNATTHTDFGSVDMVRSTDGGDSWSEPVTLHVNDPATQINTLDPCLFTSQDGTVHAFVAQKNVETGRIGAALYATSTDHGQTFGPFETFWESGDDRTMWISSHPLVLDDGAIYLPTIEVRAGQWENVLWRSDDHGAHWSEHAIVTGPGDLTTCEWSLEQIDGGHFHAVFRHTGYVYTFARVSTDYGQTWSDQIDITDQVGTFHDPELTWVDADRTVLMLAGRKRTTALRGSVTAFFSLDGGDTWTHETTIETYQEGGGYTSTVRRDDGTLLMVYHSDIHRRYKPDIRSVVLTPVV